MSGIINPDDILSAFYARLNGDSGPDGFRTMVPRIDKGPKRRKPTPPSTRPENPSATISLLTLPIDGETSVYRSTVIVNVYMDDLSTGQAAVQALGVAPARVQWLFHEAHLPAHPQGPLQRAGLRFHTVYVQEPLFL